MEWYYWFLMAVGVLWIVCAIVNYVLIKKMEWDALLQGEGGHFWLFFAPFWVIPFALQYRDWQKEPNLLRDLEKIRRRLKDRQERGDTNM